MLLSKIKSITDVAEYGLCTGCGACASVDQRISMVDDCASGLRPLVDGGRSTDTTHALGACPGVALEHSAAVVRQPGLHRELLAGFGPVYELWEGGASDTDLRYSGSSGGAASALAVHCMLNEGMYGALHIAARADAPYLNETVLSTTPEQILERTGSRYAPASPCDRLSAIVEAPAPCVFIGKPCDVAALQKARGLWPELDRNVGLTIAFFCAGTPSTQGTLEMLRRMGVEDPATLVSLRYRGCGWPGKATAVMRTESGEETRELTYGESWGDILTHYKQWRCKLCADHTGEFADIAVGDPWYREVKPGESGSSLILARTARGREIVERAIASGVLDAAPAEPWKLPASQPNLLKTRGAVWGRVLACRILGMPAPRYRRLPTFRFWIAKLTLKERVQSIAGTIRRVLRADLRHPHPVNHRREEGKAQCSNFPKTAPEDEVGQ